MEFPFLTIPAPAESEPKSGNPNPPKVFGPGFRRQSRRLEPTFSRLRDKLNSTHELKELKSDPASIAPERALVLEIAEGVQDFAREAARLGFEYLGEFESELEPNDDFKNRHKPDRNFSEKIYVALPTLASLKELLSLWTSYQSGNKLPRGFSSWSKLFDLLVDIRPWGPKDRLPEDSREILAFQLENAVENVRLELEVWHSDSEDIRNRFSVSVSSEIKELGGEVIDESVIPEIKYHGILVDFSVDVVRQLVTFDDVSLLNRDEIMYIRPQAMSIAEEPEDESDESIALDGEDEILGNPICAILDGVPIQNHELLRKWLLLDDPDDVDKISVVKGRFHGTSMASLVVHGDLNGGGDSIKRKVYLRPMMYSSDGGVEVSLDNFLIIDLVHRAVKRIKEGDNEGEAVAPEVLFINLSMGDKNRPFSNSLSPWARLIDYLSYKYNLIFFISAGNISEPITISGYDSWTSFEDDDAVERHKRVLLALDEQKAFRTILSPSESVNALTVGAKNFASLRSDYVPPGLQVALGETEAPNISSALGLGYRGAVKPDFLMPGGRELVRYLKNDQGVVIAPVRGNQFSGARVAWPSDVGELDKTAYSTGTSVATALTCHLAHKIYDVLMDRQGGSFHSDIPEKFLPVVIKSLLVHSAKWPGITNDLDDLMEPRRQGGHIARRSNITRLFGYGVIDEDRALECARNRATLIGYGEISADEGNLYKIPLPQSLDGEVAFRSMTVTISWLAPINPNHVMYKRATIDIDNGDGKKDFGYDLQRKDQLQPNHFVSGKSTILHEHFSGERAVAISQNDEIPIRIFCKSQAGELFSPVPYSIVVSFEVSAEAGIDVYSEIKQKIAVGVRQ